MNYELENIKDFNLAQTLQCGQCFHFKEIGDNEFLVSALGRILHLKQVENNLVFYNVSENEYLELWENYFDLKRDYGEIKEQLLSKDGKLKSAIDAMNGVRILNQEFFETMISFIISQNQQIPRIKQIIANISSKYGIKGEGLDIFPDYKAILAAGEEGMMDCKAGFRGKYIINACEKYAAGELDAATLRSLPYIDTMAMLKKVKGIGDKVANCIALFSLGKREAFPVDVWIKRIMEEMYFGKETPIADIQAFAEEHFGELGGYAQQYLFYYGKVNAIGKNKK